MKKLIGILIGKGGLFFYTIELYIFIYLYGINEDIAVNHQSKELLEFFNWLEINFDVTSDNIL